MHASILKYFIEVAQCGSVRKASERLYVAASAVNRQIHKLEDELGVELFDRMPNGLRLNPAGERLLKHAQETLHQFQVMRTEPHCATSMKYFRTLACISRPSCLAAHYAIAPTDGSALAMPGWSQALARPSAPPGEPRPLTASPKYSRLMAVKCASPGGSRDSS